MEVIVKELLISNLRKLQEEVAYSEILIHGIGLAIDEVMRQPPVPKTPNYSELLAKTSVEAFNMGVRHAKEAK